MRITNEQDNTENIFEIIWEDQERIRKPRRGKIENRVCRPGMEKIKNKRIRKKIKNSKDQKPQGAVDQESSTGSRSRNLKRK